MDVEAARRFLRWLLSRLRQPSRSESVGVAVVASALLAALASKHRLWLRCQQEVWRLQLGTLFAPGAWDNGPAGWVQFQYHVWKLLQLELARRLEEGAVGRDHLAPGVPHVDTGAKMNKKSAKVR